jgi:hypothetical protein
MGTNARSARRAQQRTVGQKARGKIAAKFKRIAQPEQKRKK